VLWSGGEPIEDGRDSGETQGAADGRVPSFLKDSAAITRQSGDAPYLEYEATRPNGHRKMRETVHRCAKKFFNQSFRAFTGLGRLNEIGEFETSVTHPVAQSIGRRVRWPAASALNAQSTCRFWKEGVFRDGAAGTKEKKFPSA